MSEAKFKISISYPPLFSPKGKPFLSQNRQFQWTHTNNIIYPVIPAYAATLLQQNGYRVYWDDAIAENLTYDQWLKRLIKRKPNLIAIETKTPVIKQHWQIINEIKKISLKIKKWNPQIVLMGDHVTALPKESTKNSSVDHVLIGGDYDRLLLNLANRLTKKTSFLSSSFPIIDRQLTQWQLYAYNNTNYKYKPGAYIMSGRDCWWGKCTFCSWTTLFPCSSYKKFSVEHTVNEIENLVNNFKVKEIFDDSGTLPIGDWLNQLCHELIKRELNKKVKIGCNMRFGALKKDQYRLMRQAGFRFILYGLESANQKTLDKINKNLNLKIVEDELKIIKKIGLEPHITIMIGFPWETKKEVLKTSNFVKNLFQKGLVDSIQATIVIPYPGTPLFDYCQKNNLLLSENWDDYDMSQPVIKSPINIKEQKKIIQNLFKSILTPKFILNKILSIRSAKDIKHLLYYVIKYVQKLKDFS